MVSIDDAECGMKLLGWSVGDVKLTVETGTVWLVVALRGEHRVLAWRVTQQEAWYAAMLMTFDLEVEDVPA